MSIFLFFFFRAETDFSSLEHGGESQKMTEFSTSSKDLGPSKVLSDSHVSVPVTFGPPFLELSQIVKNRGKHGISRLKQPLISKIYCISPCCDGLSWLCEIWHLRHLCGVCSGGRTVQSGVPLNISFSYLIFTIFLYVD